MVADRLLCLKSILLRRKELKYLKFFEGIQSLCKWYGVSRYLVNQRMNVVHFDSQLDWINLGEFGIAWPREYDVSRFVGALVELWAPSNAHFYFRKPTEMRKGYRVVDVGASEGAFAVECLVRHEAETVWCFEPDESMSFALRTTAERNNLLDRLHIIPAAVTERSGSLRFVENPIDPLASFSLECLSTSEQPELAVEAKTVVGVSLDDWASQTGVERVDYIKIDAEGSDLAVLQGARRCLERWRPSLAVTTYHRPNHCNEMIEYLTSLNLGYSFSVNGVIVFDSVPRPVMLHAASSNRII